MMSLTHDAEWIPNTISSMGEAYTDAAINSDLQTRNGNYYASGVEIAPAIVPIAEVVSGFGGLKNLFGDVAETAVKVGDDVVSNPLPNNGIFARVTEREYAEAFAQGSGTIGGGQVWITAADDVSNITTRQQAQQTLYLYHDFNATIPNTTGDTLVQFQLKDINNNSLMTPIETGTTSPVGPAQPRGYGFQQGGTTVGEAREWLIENGTKDEIGAFDINLINLD